MSARILVLFGRIAVTRSAMQLRFPPSAPRPGLRAASCLAAMAVLASCATAPFTMRGAPTWAQRLPALQQDGDWDMQGRAAVAVGKRGWQASVDWRQEGNNTTLRLAGPLGVGASLLRLNPDGLSVNGAPPRRDVVDQLQQRIGFDLPLTNLRYWLLGVPDPGAPYSVTLNESDRARQLTQAGWTIDFQRSMRFRGDWLPAALVLTRAGVRVRMAIDRWDGVR